MCVCVCVFVCVCMSVHSCPCTVSTTGINLKILIVDIHKKDVLPPVHMRAEQEWSVSLLKTEIGKVHVKSVLMCLSCPCMFFFSSQVCFMDPSVMELVLELYNDSRHLGNNTHTLRQEGLFRKHCVSAHAHARTHIHTMHAHTQARTHTHRHTFICTHMHLFMPGLLAVTCT